MWIWFVFFSLHFFKSWKTVADGKQSIPKSSQIRIFVAKVPLYEAVVDGPLDCLTVIQDISNLVRCSSLCFVCSSESTHRKSFYVNKDLMPEKVLSQLSALTIDVCLRFSDISYSHENHLFNASEVTHFTCLIQSTFVSLLQSHTDVSNSLSFQLLQNHLR